MNVNFKLIFPDLSDMSADKINWVTWKTDGAGGLSSIHNGPGVGRSLVLDLQTMSLSTLLELSQNKFEGLSALTQKTAHTYLSKPIISVEESNREFVKYTTEDGQFELLINANPIWTTRSPFSLA